MRNHEHIPLTTSAFIAALTERVATLISSRDTLERERSRLDDWRTSGSDECRLLVQWMTGLQAEIQHVHDLIEQQYGFSPSDGSWRRLLRGLHALSDPGDEAAIQITAYSAVSHLLTVEALRQRREARTALHDLLFETRAIEEVLDRTLAEQGVQMLGQDGEAQPPSQENEVPGTVSKGEDS